MSDPDPHPESIADSVPDPSFAIPRRPERRYSRGGGLSYEGTTVFVLTPGGTLADGEAGEAVDRVTEDGRTDSDARLCALVENVLDADPYTYGDWFDLPMPVFLVHDRETGDVFRVAIRNGTVEFHVLPDTEPGGLSALYERLCAATEDGSVGTGAKDARWHVECRTDLDR